MTKKAPSKTEAKTDTKSKKNKEALTLPEISEADISVLNRLYDVVQSRKGTDPSVSHSARLLSRGTYKIARSLGKKL